MRKLFYTLVVVLIVHCTFNIENCAAQPFVPNPVMWVTNGTVRTIVVDGN